MHRLLTMASGKWGQKGQPQQYCQPAWEQYGQQWCQKGQLWQQYGPQMWGQSDWWSAQQQAYYYYLHQSLSPHPEGKGLSSSPAWGGGSSKGKGLSRGGEEAKGDKKGQKAKGEGKRPRAKARRQRPQSSSLASAAAAIHDGRISATQRAR